MEKISLKLSSSMFLLKDVIICYPCHFGQLQKFEGSNVGKFFLNKSEVFAKEETVIMCSGH